MQDWYCGPLTASKSRPESSDTSDSQQLPRVSGSRSCRSVRDATAGLRELLRMLTALAPAPNFGDDAACLGYENPEAFFTDEEEPDEDATTAALAICQACPVRAACLKYAARNGRRQGIGGGALPQHGGEGSYSTGKCENGHAQ